MPELTPLEQKMLHILKRTDDAMDSEGYPRDSPVRRQITKLIEEAEPKPPAKVLVFYEDAAQLNAEGTEYRVPVSAICVQKQDDAEPATKVIGVCPRCEGFLLYRFDGERYYFEKHEPPTATPASEPATKPAESKPRMMHNPKARDPWALNPHSECPECLKAGCIPVEEKPDPALEHFRRIPQDSPNYMPPAAPKPRRWVVEFPAMPQGEALGWEYTGSSRVIREVKPITHQQAIEAYRISCKRTTPEIANDDVGMWVLTILRELGIEVED